MTASLVCVLRSGGDFRPEHVQALARRLPGLICLADVPVPGVDVRPLASGWKGWWAKMEAYGPAIEGDMLLADLDTIVRQVPPMPACDTVLPDFYRPKDQNLIGSGFVYITAATRARIWDSWNTGPEAHMARCVTRTCWGDQGFLAPILSRAARWGDNVVSYKVHCQKGIPPGADVVCFHGKPRPWETHLWKRYAAQA